MSVEVRPLIVMLALLVVAWLCWWLWKHRHDDVDNDSKKGSDSDS